MGLRRRFGCRPTANSDKHSGSQVRIAVEALSHITTDPRIYLHIGICNHMHNRGVETIPSYDDAFKIAWIRVQTPFLVTQNMNIQFGFR